MDITFILEAVVVLAAIVMGTRAGGVGVGVWGGLGVAVLVFIFGEAPGEPPISALLIILVVVTAAALMQAAGGVDWMVKVAAGIISRHPKQITLIAPLTAFLFSVGAGTSNILYPLLPVIYDVSYQNNVRPSRPLTVSVVQSGMSLAASPVSAAMAAMLTLTAVEPFNFDLAQILSITIPAGIVGIVVTALIVGRMWPDMDEDPDIQEKIASGALARPGAAGEQIVLESTKEGRNSAIVFLLGVVAIVILGLFPDLRPAFDVGGELVPIDMTTTIELVMFSVAVLILIVGKPDVSEVPGASVFKAGMVSAIALFGIAWLTATFIAAHEEFIVTTIGGWVNQAVWIFALAVFLVAALTTSQSTATRTIVPIGLAAGLAPGLVTGMWGGALGGVYTLPANGTQIAAANFDLTGSTKLGTKLLDHSFFVPMLIMTVTSVIVGALIGVIFYGT
jgi:anaerobic C4-dicarboxylate transporter DcuA/anaerobic C4-dicarboxylate transporter DcuB